MPECPSSSLGPGSGICAQVRLPGGFGGKRYLSRIDQRLICSRKWQIPHGSGDTALTTPSRVMAPVGQESEGSRRLKGLGFAALGNEKSNKKIEAQSHRHE